MQIFTVLFKSREIIDILPILWYFGPKLILWRHTRARIFKCSKFGLYNRISSAKISLNANFHLSIQIPRGIIDILPILGYFGPKLVLWRHRRARVFKFSKFGLHNRIHPAKINLNANFHLFIQISRGIIDILLILGYFWA